MILLDTNVVSALMRREPDGAVVAWLDGLPAESVWLPSIAVFEVRFGLERLPASRRRRALEQAFARALEEDFQDRVVPFDRAAAGAAGAIAAERRLSGHPVEVRDVQIAGIARARKATLATRNTRHFRGLGLSFVDPWSASRRT